MSSLYAGMPIINDLESHIKELQVDNTLALKNLILENATRKGFSLRSLAKQLNVYPSYLSEVLNGKRKWNVEFLSRVVDLLDIPRSEAFRLVGWLDAQNVQKYLENLRAASKDNPNLQKVYDTLMGMSEIDRINTISILLAVAEK